MKIFPEEALKSSKMRFFMKILVILFTFYVPQGEPFAQSVNFLYVSAGFSPGTAYSRPLGIFFDEERKECYIADTGNHQVVVCDDNGIPIYRFVHYTGDDNDTPGEPKSLVVDSKGRIFLTDATARYLDILDYRGVSIKRLYPDSPSERFDYLALGPGQRVYATVSGVNKKVAVINPELNIERIFSLELIKEEVPFLSGIAVDNRGRIYIADAGSEVMIQIFDSDGKYLKGFGHHDTGFENFSFPSGIALSDSGHIFVADEIRQIVSCFTPDGDFLFYVGGKGIELGSFNFPTAVATAGNDRLFVLERVSGRYQCFGLVQLPGLNKEETNISSELSRKDQPKGGETK